MLRLPTSNTASSSHTQNAKPRNTSLFLYSHVAQQHYECPFRLGRGPQGRQSGRESFHVDEAQEVQSLHRRFNGNEAQKV